MKICGVDIKGSEANLVIVESNGGNIAHINCATRKMQLGDDTDCQSLRLFYDAIKTFAYENQIAAFSIKSRAKNGQMAGGAISFKIETLFQLSDTPTIFVNPVALAKFGKTNMAGIPNGVYKYQQDAYRCAVFHINKQ